MRFKGALLITVFVGVVALLHLPQQQMPSKVLASEVTLEPSGAGVFDSNRSLTQRMIDRRNGSITTGNARVLPQAEFWIGPARIDVWKNFVDVDFFLGGLFVATSLVPPNEHCKDFQVFIHWWYGEAYGFNVWSYPTGSCT